MSEQKRIPQHVAIIMDGNGRWARLHGKERYEGHIAGVEPVRASLRAAARFSAFSDKTARCFAGRSEQKNRARTFRSGADMNFVYSPRKGRRATMRAFLIAFESSL